MNLADPLFLIIIFVIGLFILIFAHHVIKNLSQPVLQREATVIAKRSEVSGSTSHFCTFELANGERIEHSVSSERIGLLVEGDRGTLISRGDWYMGFYRKRR